MSDQETPESDQERPLIAHLVELRSRLLNAVLCILIVFLGLSFFAGELYTHLAQPLIEKMPEGAGMIATGVAAPFFAPFKLALVLSIFISVPYLFYHLWAFIAPALYRHEKRLMLPLLASSTLLFYSGVVFAYYVVFPLIFGFFTSVAPEGVTVMTDITSYLDFVLKLFMAFGMAFEIPIATILLAKTGMVSVPAMREKRPYIIVGAFVVGMLLTPPDIISQMLLALPVWLLFEVGVFIAGVVTKDDGEEEG